MITSVFLLVGGVIPAWFGGSLFVNGIVGMARWARWPVAVIGVTVAAFGTSSPELMVAIQSSMDGVPQISLGDVLGSNVVNIGLVLAVVISLSGMKAEDTGVRRDWTCTIALPFIMVVVLADGWFSRVDALVLMGFFAAWLGMVVRHALRHRERNKEVVIETGRASPLKIVMQVVAGLALLMAAAQLVVLGGKGVAQALGWSPFIVGAVVVALATGTPELATTIMARHRGHHDVGLANILGSNVFNALFVASMTALIRPYAVNLRELTPSLIFGFVTTLMIVPGRSGVIGRWRGFVLLGLYGLYLIKEVSTA